MHQRAHLTQSKNLMLDTLDLLQTMIERERDTEFDHKRNLKQQQIANSYARSNTQAQIQRDKVYLKRSASVLNKLKRREKTKHSHARTQRLVWFSIQSETMTTKF